MDKRNEYRCVQVPTQDGRWLAQYRRWWSPFWKSALDESLLDYEYTFPLYFGDFAEAEAWCNQHAMNEVEQARIDALPKKIVSLGRLP